MGVPSLFRTIAERYPDVHYWDPSLHVDHLYIDYNCLLHHCKSKLQIAPGTSSGDVDEELVAEAIRYTSYIITEVVKPRKLVYIAIDGPVPMGKLVRQRARRYKKVQDDAFRKKLCAKHNVETSAGFDGNKITPGTAFMMKLSARLKSFALLGSFSKHITKQTKRFNVLISDASIPGEGEQKIVDFMRNGKHGASVVVYGLDADLIVLSMLLDRGIKLLREPQNSPIEMSAYHDSPFLYLDIERCTHRLLKEYNLECYNREKVVLDFVLLSFFGGNDFVDAFVHTKMRDGGLTTFMAAYSKTLKETQRHLVTDTGVPCVHTLTNILNRVAETEDHAMKRLQKRWAGSGSAKRRPEKTATPQELIDYEMQLYEHSLYCERSNPFHVRYKDAFHSICFQDPHSAWKAQYNGFYFDHKRESEVCDDYLKCIAWTMKYYTENCPSWLWAYPHRNAPLCSSLAQHLTSMKQNELNEIWNGCVLDDKPLEPLEQLVAVLPPQCSSLLPFSYSKIVEDIFPKSIVLDAAKGLKNIYSEPLLPPIDYKLIYKLVSCVPVNEKEAARNETHSRAFCVKF